MWLLQVVNGVNMDKCIIMVNGVYDKQTPINSNLFSQLNPN